MAIDWGTEDAEPAPTTAAGSPVPQRELRCIEEAVILLDEWIAEYRDLLKRFRRLECEAVTLRADLDSARFLLRHLDPFLPPAMQDERLRAEQPQIYKAIAENITKA